MFYRIDLGDLMRTLFFMFIFNVLAGSGFSAALENDSFLLNVELVITQAMSDGSQTFIYDIKAKPDSEIGEIKKHLIDFFYQETSKDWTPYMGFKTPNIPRDIPVKGKLPREVRSRLTDMQDAFRDEMNDLPFVFAGEKISSDRQTIKDICFFNENKSDQKLTMYLDVPRNIPCKFCFQSRDGKIYQEFNATIGCLSLIDIFDQAQSLKMHLASLGEIPPVELTKISSKHPTLGSRELQEEFISNIINGTIQEIDMAFCGSTFVEFCYTERGQDHNDDVGKITKGKQEALTFNVAIEVKGLGRKEFILVIDDPQAMTLEALLPLFRQKVPEIPMNHVFLMVAGGKNLLEQESTMRVAQLVEKHPNFLDKMVIYTN